MDCIDYLVKLIDVNRSFSNLSLVKVKSFLEPFDVKHSPDNEDTYLVIGKNLIGYGLTKLGYTHVKSLQGLPNFGDLSCDKYDDDVELGDLIAQETKFDYVIAPDEWLTYYAAEKDQLLVIDQISRITNKGFYTTLKDYKNMHIGQRYFQEPFELKSNNGSAIVIRKRDWNRQERQCWIDRTYIIHKDNLEVCEPKERRTMYFKQLAKFSIDAGAINFQVEKKLMYKPVFSKSFEYVIHISF